jgi:hypothetical protein
MMLAKCMRLSDHLWGISSPYHQPTIECARSLGMSWSKKKFVWTGYSDSMNVLIKEMENSGAFRVGGERPPSVVSLSGPGQAPALLRPYQRDGFNFLINHAGEGCLLADVPGLGKAQPIDAKVLTPDGWKAIGTIRVGDQVFGSDGKPKRVVGVYPQGRKKVYRVEMNDGAVTYCCKDHLWGVQTANDRKRRVEKLRVLSTDELIAAGLQQPAVERNHKWFVPMTAAIQFTQQPFPLDPYLLGALIANGSISTRTVTHHGGDDQREAFQTMLPKNITLNKSPGNAVTARIVQIPRFYRSGKRKAWKENAVVKILRELGLTGTECHTKFVPAQYLLGSVAQRLALLQGLMDNDGTVTKDGIVVEYNTVSPQLAADVLFIVRSLGGKAILSTRYPTYTYKGERLTGRLDHRIRISLPHGMVPFRIERKLTRFRPRTKYPPAHAITSIDAVGMKQCVCIAIDSADHLYVTDDCILTHNTVTTLSAIPILGYPAIIVCPSAVKYTWVDDGKKLGLDVFILDGRKPPKAAKLTPQDGILVLNYDIVAAWLPHLQGVRTVVFDEIHALANEKSQRSKACRELAKQADYRIGTSGTPMPNRIKDLYNVLTTLSPGRFGRFITGLNGGTPSGFGVRYCNGHQVDIDMGNNEKKKVWDFNGKSHVEELQFRMQHFMLRRTKEDVALQLPPKTRQVINMDVDGESIAEWSFKDSDSVRFALGLAAEGKINPCVELALEHMRNNSSVIVFCYRHEVADRLVARFQEEGVEAFTATGLMSTEKRKASAETAKAAGASVLVATIRSVGEGVNYLSYANVAMFCELDYVPRWLMQAEDRLHRIGQARNVLIQYLIGLGTIDEIIRDKVLQKLITDEELFGEQKQGLKRSFQGGQTDDEALAELAEMLRAS